MGMRKCNHPFLRYYLLTGWNKTSRGASRLAAGKTCGVGILPRFISFVEGGGFVFFLREV
jgi:hypothetical protein